jgi:hypothetical protein
MNNLQALGLHQLYLMGLVLFYIVYKQVVTRPVKGSRYIIIPLLLIYFTLESIDSITGGLGKAAVALTILASVGVITGVISGMLTKIFRGEDGILYQSGGVSVLVFLVITIPIRIMLRYTLGHIPGNEVLNYAGLSYLVMISCQMVAKSIVVIWRRPEVLQLIFQQRADKARRRLERRIERNSRRLDRMN